MPLLILNCDQISYKSASTHVKLNLCFGQKWITSLIHYHISFCTTGSFTDSSQMLLSLWRAQIWPLDTYHPYYYHLWYYHQLEKTAQNRAYLGIRNLYTHTVIAVNRWIIGANFAYTALGTGKLLHNYYFKSPNLPPNFSASKPGFVKSSHIQTLVLWHSYCKQASRQLD